MRVLITGASAGIGEAYVRLLAERCETMVLLARRRDRLARLARELEGRCEIVSLEADLATVEGIAVAVEAIRQGPALDLLINNAGFSTFGPYAQSTLDDELQMVRLHLDATLALSRAALPAMIAERRGAVINVASIGGFLASPNVAVYGATKSFLLSFSRSLRAELSESGVRVQCLCPGYTRTEIHSRDSMQDFDEEVVPERYWMSAEAVVEASLQALDADDWLVVPGDKNRQVAALGLKGLAPLSSSSE